MIISLQFLQQVEPEVLKLRLLPQFQKGKKILVVDNGAYGARMANIASTFGIEVAYTNLPTVTIPISIMLKNC